MNSMEYLKLIKLEFCTGPVSIYFKLAPVAVWMESPICDFVPSHT